MTSSSRHFQRLRTSCHESPPGLISGDFCPYGDRVLSAYDLTASENNAISSRNCDRMTLKTREGDANDVRADMCREQISPHVGRWQPERERRKKIFI